MENKAHRLQAVTLTLLNNAREFFDLATPASAMPVSQLTYFATQAQARHYLVALYFQGEDQPMIGHVTRHLGGDRLLIQGYRSNVVRVAPLAQLRYLKRV
ncbi:hypothetical protein [Lacticaseibacillus parakribbianus]|uniref:hypothetical protein n=1 Tax=Lacticaseibacillus parakribbianus TaxID=2970927 RepID=UPI0021CB2313|nr:hypothetical protein [Lacticaseibacillus parakribbianus]